MRIGRLEIRRLPQYADWQDLTGEQIERHVFPRIYRLRPMRRMSFGSLTDLSDGSVTRWSESYVDIAIGYIRVIWHDKTRRAI